MREIKHLIGDIFVSHSQPPTKEEGRRYAERARQRQIAENKKKYAVVYSEFYQRGGLEWYAVLTGETIDQNRIYWDIGYLADRINHGLAVEREVIECGLTIGSREFKRIQKAELIGLRDRKDHIICSTKVRGALISLGTPCWADRIKMQGFYKHARELTATTGIPHEVDHIIPIKHKRVCGLHNEFNLQVLTKAENQKKGSRFYA